MKTLSSSIGVIGAFLLLLCSCGPSLTPTPTPPAIQVIPSNQPREKIEIGAIEPVSQNNCGGSATVSYSFERSRAIVYALDLSQQVTVNADGTIGVPGVGSVQAGVSVASTYGVSYGQEDRISRSITVQADKGTNMVHRIQQYEYWEKGEIVITANNIPLRLPYRFRRDFGIELLGSVNMQCSDGKQTGKPATQESPNTPVNLPTIAPPTISPPIQPQPVILPTESSEYCYGEGWRIDDAAKTMTWICSGNGIEDIWQPGGVILNNIRRGYTTIITTNVPGEIFACNLSLDGKLIKNSCDGKLVRVRNSKGEAVLKQRIEAIAETGINKRGEALNAIM
jgi:hypothetical protein